MEPRKSGNCACDLGGYEQDLTELSLSFIYEYVSSGQIQGIWMWFHEGTVGPWRRYELHRLTF